MFHNNNAPTNDRLLLLVLSSLSFVGGLNAWYLNHTMIATCLDLGLQRKHTIGMALPYIKPLHFVNCFGAVRPGSVIPGLPRHNVPLTTEETVAIRRTKEGRSGIFCSLYSLGRTLCIILGRPLTIRDEAIDIELPGQTDSTEDSNAIQDRTARGKPSRKKFRTLHSPHSAAIYSILFDRINGEIKVILYRLTRSFNRFPWPTDRGTWQSNKGQACRNLLEDSRQDIKRQGIPGRRAALQDRTMRTIELKFHQCMILLNRPCPAIPQPSPTALMACYRSSIASIRIQSELARFGNMLNSWLTAHAIFVSDITSLYCLWRSPEVRKSTDLETFLQQAESCSQLLASLSKTWSVAYNAQTNFDQLVQLTKESWGKSNTKAESTAAMSPQNYRVAIYYTNLGAANIDVISRYP